MCDFTYRKAEPSNASRYIWPAVLPLIPAQSAVFDLGCGNGAFAGLLGSRGHRVTGVDVSESGIQIARSHAGGAFFVGSAYDDLASRYGQFPVVVSLEVVEHCYYPRAFANTVFNLVAPGGAAIISTPFHGYIKNVAIALTGRFDAHVNPLWDGGHIKFWSEKTLDLLLTEAGFTRISFRRVGRISALAKSMIAIAIRP